MYYLEKMGVYSHGVFWIGTDIEEGKRMADKAANSDKDDYHDWELRKLLAPNETTDFAIDARDNGHAVVYVGCRTLPDTGAKPPCDEGEISEQNRHRPAGSA